MASLISHAVVALGIGAAFYKPHTPKRVLALGAVCSMLPDIDVVGFHFGVHYGDFWGHRGITHSLLFAGLLATLMVATSLAGNGNVSANQKVLWLYFFLATASHGFLDAMTNGGLGVALFSPFDTSRYFLPWRPILVSPIGVWKFFSSRGVAVLRSEVIWIWVPAALVALLALALRRFLVRNPTNGSLNSTSDRVL